LGGLAFIVLLVLNYIFPFLRISKSLFVLDISVIAKMAHLKICKSFLGQVCECPAMKSIRVKLHGKPLSAGFTPWAPWARAHGPPQEKKASTTRQKGEKMHSKEIENFYFSTL